MLTGSYVIYVELPETKDEMPRDHGDTGVDDRMSRRMSMGCIING
jgi:hypothetical protein